MDDRKLLQLLHNIAKQQNYQNYELKVNPVSSAGGSFTSRLYSATITNQNSALNLNLFVKVATMGANMRKEITVNIYIIEEFVYTDLKISYRKIEDKFKVPEAKRFNFPEHFGVHSTPCEEILVLEDLSADGYLNHDRLEPIDWPYASAAVSELAKFHALSIAYQRDYIDKTAHIAQVFASDWINENSVRTIWKPAFATTITAVRDENKAKMTKFLDNIDLAAIKDLDKPLRCTVLSHNDFRTSNLMHRTKDDGTPEIKLIDFQTLQLGCPVLDILYLVFTGTDKAFRDDHFQRLIDHYYEELTEAMERLDLDSSRYTRDDYDFELKEKMPFGLLIASFTLIIVTLDAADAPAITDDMDLSNFSLMKPGPLFAQRLNEIVDDYIRWGILTD